MSDQFSPRRILVTGVGGPAGKAVTSFLGNRCIPLVGVDMNPAVAELTTHPFYVVPAGDHSEFIEHLLEIAITERIHVIIPTVDEELIPLASHRSLFEEQGIRVVVSPMKSVRICRDKYQTATFLLKRAIPCPQTVLANDTTHLPLPLLGKPRSGRGGNGVVILTTKGQVEDAKRRYGASYVFQEFVPGPEYDVNVFIQGGEIEVNQVLLKTQLEHGLVGNAVATVKINDSEIEDLAANAAAALQLEGPVDIDIRRDEQHTPKILEVNPRVGAHILKAPAVLTQLLQLEGTG